MKLLLISILQLINKLIKLLKPITLQQIQLLLTILKFVMCVGMEVCLSCKDSTALRVQSRLLLINATMVNLFAMLSTAPGQTHFAHARLARQFLRQTRQIVILLNQVTRNLIRQFKTKKLKHLAFCQVLVP